MGGYIMTKEQQNLVKRIKTAQGHLGAVAAMVEKDVYCMDIINQNHAVIEALRKVNELILEGYLGECALDAVNHKNPAKRKAAVAELVKIYTKK